MSPPVAAAQVRSLFFSLPSAPKIASECSQVKAHPRPRPSPHDNTYTLLLSSYILVHNLTLDIFPGNIGADTSTPATSTSLATPTIKSSTYTTGRGGQGNMAPNDPSVPAHAEMARVAQDVGAPASREVQSEGHAYLHHGRGGGGNLVKVEGAGDGAGGQGGRGERTRVIEGENGDWEEEGTGAPVELSLIHI